jgi:hypothetical protein
MQAREVWREKPVKREGRQQQGTKASGKYPKPPLAQHGARQLQRRSLF